MDAINAGWMHIAWAQCWQVSLLILAVWMAVRFAARNRPHLASMLWLAVLIKCVTPPLWSSPSSVFSWLQTTSQRNEIAAPVHAWDLSQQIAADGDQPASDDVAVEISRSTMSTQEAMPTDTSTLSTPWYLRSSWSAWSGLLAASWAVGCACFASLAALRCARCWQQLRRAGVCEAPEVVRMVDRLRQQIGLRRPVKVIVSRSPVGPAVVGLIRPTMILPALIVDAKLPAELEPLLAHELVHIKRGDLWVGLIQLVSQGVWWFHPLVRVANRLLTREIERCCDEEVIAHLRCDPGQYARSLIDVLSLKRTLQPVPAFPGVRPVDVTSQRLERIMKLGQGCHKRTPYWCWGVLLAMIASTLPGAALIVAEEETAPKTRDLSPGPQLAPAPIPAPPVPAVASEPLQFRVYDATDLVNRFKKEVDDSDERARQTILDSAVHALERTVEPRTSKRVIDQKSPEPKLGWNGNALLVGTTELGHAAIGEAFDRLRQDGFQLVQVQVRIITGNQANLDLFPLELKVLEASRPDEDIDKWNDEAEDANRPVRRVGSQVSGRVESVIENHHFHRMAVADAAQVEAIVTKAQADPRTNIMQAPRVIVYNGQRASISDRVKRPFVVAHQKTSEGVYKPIVRLLHEGYIMQVRPRLLDERAELCGVELKMAVSELLRVETPDFPSDQNQPFRKVQSPQVATTRIQTNLELNTNQTLVIGDLSVPNGNKEMQPLMLLVQVRRVKPEAAIPPAAANVPAAAVRSNQAGTVLHVAADAPTILNPVRPLEAPPAVPQQQPATPGDEQPPEELLTAVYHVADLVIPLNDAPVIFTEDGSNAVGSTREPQGKPDYEPLLEIIKRTVSPDSWDEKGGTGSVRPFEKSLSLVVRQTKAVHQEIREMLVQLRHLQDLQSSFHLQRVTISPPEFEAWAQQERDPQIRELASTIRNMPVPAISISQETVAQLQQAQGVTVHSGPKLTLFNAQRMELQLAKPNAESNHDVAWIQLNPVISADLRMIRINVITGTSADDKNKQKSGELITMPRKLSLLIDLSQQSWTKREAEVPILNKVPHVSQLFQNPATRASSATRQFYLVTPTIILAHDEAEATQEAGPAAAKKSAPAIVE